MDLSVTGTLTGMHTENIERTSHTMEMMLIVQPSLYLIFTGAP